MHATAGELGIEFRGRSQDRFPCPRCGRDDVLSVDFDKAVYRCFRPSCELYSGGKLVAGDGQPPVQYQSAPPSRTGDQSGAAALRIWDEALRIYHGDKRPDYARAGYLYLLGRGIQNPESDALRQHPGLYCREIVDRGLDKSQGASPKPPALIARVTDARGAFLGIQRIWTGRDEAGPGIIKAPLQSPKKALGPIAGGVVRIDAIGPEHRTLAIAEGIETALAVRDLAVEMFGDREVPVWSAVSAGNMPGIAPCIPPMIRVVHICADNDNAGRLAADQLAERLKAARRDRRVTIRRPRHEGDDYGDILIRRTRREDNLDDRHEPNTERFTA